MKFGRKTLLAAVFFCAALTALLPRDIFAAGDRNEPGQLRIVTSFYPVYIATLNIVKDVPDVRIINLTKPFAGCLHDYQLSPDDLKTLGQADIFVINGAGMESFLEKALHEIHGLKIINASKGIEFIKDEHGTNPHVWLSVTLAIKQVQNIAAELAAYDAAHATQYQENSAAYIRRLEELRARMQSGLAALKSREIVTFHEAFPYFAREFNLKIVAVVEREPGSEPSAREMAETITTIRKSGARAIFIEPQYPEKSARAIARETGAAVCVLDPTVTGPLTENAYLRTMENNLAVLTKTLKD